jgi:glutathione synthase/RimK-type ligase-like ATP-grasp enzyme
VRRILLVTTASDLAADLVIFHLRRRDVQFIRFNQEDFPERAAIAWPSEGSCATLAVDGEEVSCANISSAWFRYPTGPTVPAAEDQRTTDFVAREATGFLAGFWETMPWFWMNRPSAVTLASSKLRQLAQAHANGFHVPKTLVTNCAQAAREFVSSRDTIVKAVVSGGFTEATQRFAIYTTPITIDDLADDVVRVAPIIFQEHIENSFDLRVTVVGTRVFSTRISIRHRDGEADWRAIDPAQLTYERYSLPSAIEAASVTLLKAFSLSFAALDFIVTPDGEHVFLEINPSGQWGWLEEATGLPITDAIVDDLIEGTP